MTAQLVPTLFDSLTSGTAAQLDANFAYVSGKFVSVKDAAYGAKGDGVTDDTAAVQAAINSLQPIFFPAGTYLISSVTIGAASSQRIFGSGLGDHDTFIKAKDATSDVIVVQAGSAEIDHIQFISSVTRTGGAYINLSGNVCFVHHVRMTAPFIGIANTGTSNFYRDIYITNVVATGVGVQINGGSNLKLSGIDCVNGSLAAAGFEITSTADVTLVQCNALGYTSGVLIDPGTGKSVSSFCASDCFFDSNTNALKIAPTGTGIVLRSRFTACWFNGTAFGALLSSVSAGASMIGFQFVGCQFFGTNGASSEGLAIGGSCAVSDVVVNGCEVSNYVSVGIDVGPLAADVTVTGNAVGVAMNGTPPTGWGILLQSGAVNLMVVGNKVRGAGTANIQDNSGVVNKLVANNLAT